LMLLWGIPLVAALLLLRWGLLLEKHKQSWP
jgi:hypothetical protein